jgi:hypothetical protein
LELTAKAGVLANAATTRCRFNFVAIAKSWRLMFQLYKSETHFTTIPKVTSPPAFAGGLFFLHRCNVISERHRASVELLFDDTETFSINDATQ